MGVRGVGRTVDCWCTGAELTGQRSCFTYQLPFNHFLVCAFLCVTLGRPAGLLLLLPWDDLLSIRPITHPQDTQGK